MSTLDACMTALTSDDPRVRQSAAMRLGTLDVESVMSALVAAMAREPDDFVRETLIWAVVACPDSATPHLVAALGEDLPREPVLHALSKVGDPSTVGAILPHAASDDPTVAGKAWWALGRIASEESLPVLVSHLGAENAQLRHGLTRALLQFGPSAIDVLATVLDGDDAAARSHAAEVLVAFADPTRYSVLERRTGRDASGHAADALRRATAPEVDGALLLAVIDDSRPGLVAAAQRLREERGHTG